MNKIFSIFGKKSADATQPKPVEAIPTPDTREKSGAHSDPSPAQENAVLVRIAPDDINRVLDHVEEALDRRERKARRRKWMWRLSAFVLAVIAALFIGSMSSSVDDGGALKIDRYKIGSAGALPVVGALPSATTTGHIAVIRYNQKAIGGLLHDDSPDSSNTPAFLAASFAAAEADPDLALVVLELTSPGGGATSSATSYRLVKEARERLAKRGIRVIGYTEEGAYSGGYFTLLGVGFGNLFANPGSDVANIGVIMHMFNTAEFGKKFGITENIVDTGPNKSTGSQWEQLKPGQRDMTQTSIDDSFEIFLDAVADGRHLDFQQLLADSKDPSPDKVSNGGWFSAKRAVKLGLIDGVIPVEYLYPAVTEKFVDKRKFNKVELVGYKAEKTTLELLSERSGRSVGMFMNAMKNETLHTNAPLRMERE